MGLIIGVLFVATIIYISISIFQKENRKKQDLAFKKIQNILRRFSINGTDYRTFEDIERANKLQKGETLYLIPEPNNEYDKNAIKVLTKDSVHIGYIPKELCRLFNNILEGKISEIYVVDIRFGKDAPYIYARANMPQDFLE